VRILSADVKRKQTIKTMHRPNCLETKMQSTSGVHQLSITIQHQILAPDRLTDCLRHAYIQTYDNFATLRPSARRHIRNGHPRRGHSAASSRSEQHGAHQNGTAHSGRSHEDRLGRRRRIVRARMGPSNRGPRTPVDSQNHKFPILGDTWGPPPPHPPGCRLRQPVFLC
jgi:hypothetical protein